MKVQIPEDLQGLLITSPPRFSTADVEKLAAKHFSIQAEAKLLASERDQNFCLKTADHQRYTFKITNHAEQLAVVEFQNGALQRMAELDPNLPLPRVIANRDGDFHTRVLHDGRSYWVRLLSWVEGSVLYDSKASPILLDELGQLLARMGLALKDYQHPGSNPPLLWDMKRASGLRGFLPCIEEPELQTLTEEALDHFDALAPELMKLRTQVIYNDLNPDNVLVDPDNPDVISGIIDFGDLVESPLIIDLAVAAAYYLAEGDDPLAGAAPLIAGYHKLRPLLLAEMNILTGLIKTRLITSILIMSWRMSEFPENREYLQRSHATSKAFLASLSRLDQDAAFEQIQAFCQQG